MDRTINVRRESQCSRCVYAAANAKNATGQVAAPKYVASNQNACASGVLAIQCAAYVNAHTLTVSMKMASGSAAAACRLRQTRNAVTSDNVPEKVNRAAYHRVGVSI